jgi:hypothetical protein
MDRIIHQGESEPIKTNTPEITAAREAIDTVKMLLLLSNSRQYPVLRLVAS